MPRHVSARRRSFPFLAGEKQHILEVSGHIIHRTPEVSGLLAYTCACGFRRVCSFFCGNHDLQPCVVDWSSYDRRRMRTTSIYGSTTSSSNTARRQQPVHTITSGMNPRDDELVQAKYTASGKVIQAASGRRGWNSPSAMNDSSSKIIPPAVEKKKTQNVQLRKTKFKKPFKKSRDSGRTA